MYQKIKIVKQVSLVILVLFLVGCNGQYAKMSAVDKAGVAAKELTSTYMTLYQIADNITMRGNAVQKEFMMTQVNPKMNKIKLALASIDRGVALWKDGGVDTLNVEAQIMDVQGFLTDITNLINSITVKS